MIIKNTIVAEQELDEDRIEGSVKLCLNAHILVNLLKTLSPNEVITLRFKDNKVQIVAEEGKYQLFGESEANYPQIKYSNLNETTVLDGEFVARLVAMNYACSTDLLRPAMKGILFNFKEDYTEFVATNGHIIHIIRRRDIKLKHENVIIPGKELSSLSDIIKNRQYIKLSLMKNHVAFSTDDSKYITSKLDERYPDYEQLINISARYKVLLSKNLLVWSLERINILQPSGDIITFIISSEKITLMAKSDFGTVNETLKIEKLTLIDEKADKEITLSFWLHKLLLLLKHLDSTDLEIHIGAPNRLVTITPVNQQENEEILTMVMPVFTPEYDE